jgi:hypothetical protein
MKTPGKVNLRARVAVVLPVAARYRSGHLNKTISELAAVAIIIPEIKDKNCDGGRHQDAHWYHRFVSLLIGDAYSIVYPRSGLARYADAGSIANSQSRSRATTANVN